MKIQKVLFALCFVLFAMTSCQKEEVPELDANGKQTAMVPIDQIPDVDVPNTLNCTVDSETPFIVRILQTGNTSTLIIEEKDAYTGSLNYRDIGTDWILFTENGTSILPNQSQISYNTNEVTRVVIRVPYSPWNQRAETGEVEIALCDYQLNVCPDVEQNVMVCYGEFFGSRYLIYKED